MPIQHSLLSGADLHEPKGIETANPNTVYVADGSGSGSWTKQSFISRGPRVDGNDSTPGYFAFPANTTIKAIALVLLDEPVSTDTNLTFVLKDSGGSVRATMSFPVSTSDAGSSLVTPTNISVPAGDFVSLEVSGQQTTSPCYVESSFLLELA